ncbi:inactive serine protease 54 isoform X1 [Tachyglossus aculeatus]|uniref:inactive serine protease 54 isoform X1 n=1 Tax=Tachyglossus aculeatus TaxID=9261 RepID=UPI0018F5DD6E|nr:inactive serine protease 54 isoform X1 [Tachyglossus aculeatus]
MRRLLLLLLHISQSSATCGIQNIIVSALPRAGFASVNEFPWMVSLQDSHYTHLMFGCIISENWILSIASSFQNRPKVIAMVGIANMNAKRRTHPEYSVNTIITHEDFDAVTMEHNIALLKTDAAMEFGDRVKPICFPRNTVAAAALSNCWVSGWIHSSTTGKPATMSVLRKLSVVDIERCPLRRHNGTACCSHRESDNESGCLGDPGNPVFCQAQDTRQWVLSGILNRGGMACFGPFLYTVVSHYSNWISTRTVKAGPPLHPTYSQKSPTPLSLASSKEKSELEQTPQPKDHSEEEKHSESPRGRARAKSHSAEPSASLQENRNPQDGKEPEWKNLDERARSKALASEPIYYDYYGGEVIPISGHKRFSQPQELILVVLLLALLYRDI